MFDFKGRVEKTNDGGCRFYDQDIVFLDYIFRNDCIVDLDIEYTTPGFGILLAEADTSDSFKNGYSILYRLGDDTYSTEDRYLERQQHVNSGAFYTKSDTYRMHLTFYKNEDKVWMTRTYYENGSEKVFGSIWLTSSNLSEALDQYRIGFYSNKGNTIYKISIASGMPKDWVVNIKNTNGGRVSFHSDGFSIEECEYNADIEQQNIELDAGTYWLSYKASKDSDIVVYVNEYLRNKEIDGHLTNQPTILDRTKSILRDDGSFTLTEKTKVNLKFTGTHGTIDEITIKDLRDSSYISTDSTGVSHRDGSMLVFDLDKISSFELNGTIFAVPDYKLTEKPTYSVFNGDTERNRTLIDTSIETNVAYDHSYDTHTYHVSGNDVTIDPKSNKLYVFKNVSGEMTNLVIHTKNGKTVDVIHSDTYKLYVSDKIQSPIIITDNDLNPYDLSAAYRETIIQAKRIELFNRYQPVNLSERVNRMRGTIEVYGIPEGTLIHKEKTDAIEEFADNYIRISTTQYTFDEKTNSVSISPDVWNNYKYVAVTYDSADKYKYLWTNWEREFFDTKERQILTLEKDVLPDIGQLVVYGIKDSEPIRKDYLYRVDNENMIHSVDFFASHYDMIDPAGYVFNEKKRRIFLKDTILDDYRYFVVDYLKDNSYAINWIPDLHEYEVDIASSDQTCRCLYDMNESGAVNTYILTNITPDRDRYITITQKD